MKVGGICDVLYIPYDINDLIYFIRNKDENIPITIIGNLSNTIVTDKGIRGICISLKNLSNIKILDNTIEVECGFNLNNFIQFCINNNISCCEQLYTIPGTIGGALAMNAGTPTFEIREVLENTKLLNISNGNIINIDNSKMMYRNGNLPNNYIAISCILKTKYKDSNNIKEIIKNIVKKRIETQPIYTNTCGSTFKNPIGYKAWQLIKESGCCGMQIGAARVSEKHCNFIVNINKATATDIENLIDLAKKRVLEKFGIELRTEIRILGKK